MLKPETAEVIIVGGGLAGLAGAIYLGRARRDVLVIDLAKSMARWEPDVQNYLGFPGGISGQELLRRARQQARRYHTRFTHDEIQWARPRKGRLMLRGEKRFYTCRRLLLATGSFHIPPDIPGVKPCLGHSMFFCKDCDGYRVQGKPIAIYGWTNETVEYALGLLPFSDCISLVTDGRAPRWDRQHAKWVREYALPVYLQTITGVQRNTCHLRSLDLEDGAAVKVEALFTTRGDIYYNSLARCLGAEVEKSGEVVVDQDMRTTVKNVYAAGCVTPANCQMIIASGQGAAAAQAINRDLFEESLATHSLARLSKSHKPKTKTQIRKNPKASNAKELQVLAERA